MAQFDPGDGQSSAPSRHEVAEHASLAEYVYHSEPAGGTGLVPEGYRLVDKFPPGGGQSENGFHAAAYETPSGDIVIAYRGTDNPGSVDGFRDLITDLNIPNSSPHRSSKAGGYQASGDNGQLDAVLAEAKSFTDRVMRTHPDQDISTTGHSLGGFISQVESNRTGVDGHAFNAPGARHYIEANPGMGSNFSNHNAEGDVIHHLTGPQHGERYTYPSDVGEHSIAPLSERIANDAQPAEGHLWGDPEPGLGPSEGESLKAQLTVAQDDLTQAAHDFENANATGQDVDAAQQRVDEIQAQLNGDAFVPVPNPSAESAAPESTDVLARLQTGLAQLRSNLS